MAIFYTKEPTKAYSGATKQAVFVILPTGQGREIADEIDGWIIFKEGSVLRFVRAEEVLHKPAPTIPADVLRRFENLEAWARGIGFKL